MTFPPAFFATAANAVLAACPRCGTRLELDDVEGGRPNLCPACGAEVLAIVLPRAAGDPPCASAESQMAGSGEAVCFFHVASAAHAPCHACGRFLCSLCELEVEGRIWCPLCLEAARTGGGLATLKSEETQYDAMALTIASASWIVWPLSILTAPVIAYLACRYWNTPRRALVPRGRWRFPLALLLICGPLAVWALLIIPGVRHAAHL